MSGPEEEPGGKPGVAACWLRILGKCICCREVHACAHWAWKIVKVAALLMFLLWAFGIPGGWMSDRIQPHIAPYHMEMQRVTWSPFRGLIIHRPAISEPALGSEPLIMADTIFIQPDYRRLWSRAWETRRIGIRNGRVLFPVSQDHDGVPVVDYMSLLDVEGSIENTAEGTRIALSALTDFGTRCTINGLFRRGGESRPGQPDTPWIRQVHDVHASLYATPEWLVGVRDRLDELTFSGEPDLSIAFHADAARPGSNRGTLSCAIPGFKFRDVDYDRMQIDLHMEGRRVDVRKVRLDKGEDSFQLSGSYLLDEDRFEAHGRNTLPMHAFSILLPASWLDRLAAEGVRFSGAMQAEAWVGPCSLKEVPRTWSGWISVADAAINDLVIRRAFASLKRVPGFLFVNDGQIEGGEGAGAGTVSFSTRTDFTAGVTEGSLDAGIELRQLKPILPPGLKRLADEFEMPDRPVVFRGEARVPHGNPDACSVLGTAYGTNTSFRGASLTGFRTGIRYDDRVLTLDPFHATCATGEVRGALVLDLPGHVYGINLESTADPKKVIPMAGAVVARHFDPYTFSDDVFTRVDGIIDARNGAASDLQVTISGRRLGFTDLVFDRLALAGRYTGSLAVTNITGSLFQGGVTGTLDIAFGGARPVIGLFASVTNIQMDALIRNFVPDATNRYEGVLNGHAALAGPVPDRPGWTNLTGRGAMEIRDGSLMRIPIFGGLSALLSKIYPGLGFTEQNHLKATFEVRDGAVFTRDLKVMGGILSFAADGSYAFNDRLDFDVRVHPFRDGTLASTLRLVTIPITLLLEFNVTGPAAKPSWNAANLPL